MESNALNTTISTDFADLVNQADCGLLIFSNNSRTTLIYGNPYFFFLFGYTEEEFREKFDNGFSSCIHPEDSQKFKSIMARQFAMGNALYFEFRALKKDGSLKWVLLRGRLHQEETTSSYYCSCLDITDIKLSFENLSKTKLEADIIANNISGGILKLQLSDYKILYANDGFYNLSGLSRSEYETTYQNICLGVLYEEDLLYVREQVQKALAARGTLSIEYRIVHKSGQLRWSFLNGTLIEEINGNPIYLCVIVNITQLKEYESRLMETQKKQLLLNNFTNEISWEYDVDTEQITRSGKIDEHGSSEAIFSLISRDSFLSNHIHPDDAAKLIEALNPHDPAHNFVKIHVRIKNHLNHYAWYLMQGITLYDKHEKPYKIIGKTTLLDSYTAAPTAKTPAFIPENELKDRANASLKDDLLMKQCALYVIAIEEKDTLKAKYGSFFYRSILDEFVSKIESIFPSAIKSRTEEDEFLVFMTNSFSIESVNRKAMTFSNAIHSSFFDTDKLPPIRYNISSYIANSDNRSFDALYEKAIGSFIFETPAAYNEDEENTVPASERGIHFLFDTIRFFDSVEDNPASFRLALASVCNFFNAEQICIFEYTTDRRQLTMTHDWSIPGSPDRIDGAISFTYDQMLNYESLFNKDSIFICTDLTILKKDYSFVYERLSTTHLHSMLESALTYNGEFLGFLSLNYIKSAQTWSPAEIEYLKILSRFITLTLVRIKNTLATSQSNPYDHVTGLVSFNHFVETANHFIQKNTTATEHYALLYMDINRFMDLNTRYGFTTGNKILKYLCHLILQHLSPDELCCRIQGDRFIVLAKYSEQKELTDRLETFNEHRLSQQAKLDEFYHFSISCGFYLIKKEDKDITAVIDKADFARKSIKSMNGSYNFAFYSKAMEQWNSKENELLLSLQTAFKNHEFVSYYQPQYWLSTEELYSIEALVRWNRPDSPRVLYPPEFLPLLEQNRQIIELDFFMIEESFKRLRLWMSQNEDYQNANKSCHCKKIVPISVNISGIHLSTTNFVERLLRLRDKYGIPSKYLAMEFTESLFIKEPEPLSSLMNELNSHGFPLTVDNFGKEYSSLGLFKRFPIDAIKIDSGFFYSNVANKKDKVLFRKIIEIAKEMNIRIISGNIETSFQADLLRELGCEVVQGSLYHKAMPVEELEKYVL